MAKKFGLAVAAVLLALGVALWLGPVRGPAQTDLSGLAAQAQETPETAELPAVPDMILGEADAPITLIEYASYTCPHCATFHANVFRNLKADYIDTGKIKFIFREVYFDRYGLWAAMVARCGGETRYFGISGILFEEQAEWAASDEPAVVVENLRTIGRTAGMDDATLDACLNDATMAQAMVARYEETTTTDQVDGTPTLIIDGEKHGNMSYDELRAILDAKLG